MPARLDGEAVGLYLNMYRRQPKMLRTYAKKLERFLRGANRGSGYADSFFARPHQ